MQVSVGSSIRMHLHASLRLCFIFLKIRLQLARGSEANLCYQTSRVDLAFRSPRIKFFHVSQLVLVMSAGFQQEFIVNKAQNVLGSRVSLWWLNTEHVSTQYHPILHGQTQPTGSLICPQATSCNTDQLPRPKSSYPSERKASAMLTSQVSRPCRWSAHQVSNKA